MRISVWSSTCALPISNLLHGSDAGRRGHVAPGAAIGRRSMPPMPSRPLVVLGLLAAAAWVTPASGQDAQAPEAPFGDRVGPRIPSYDRVAPQVDRKSTRLNSSH